MDNLENIKKLLLATESAARALGRELAVAQGCTASIVAEFFPESDCILLDRSPYLRPFRMARYPVTAQQYALLMGEGEPDQRAAGGISWYDAIEFCNRLSVWAGLQPCYTIYTNELDPNNLNEDDPLRRKVVCDWNANGYRLPTEAEWEYAAEGGRQRDYLEYSGSNDWDAVAWHRLLALGERQVVGQKKPNELGLYDMSGNVWEWCWDWYDEWYNIYQLENPHGPDSGEFRCMRGGSCQDLNPRLFRPGHRYCGLQYEREDNVGLRLVRNAAQG